MSNKISIVQLTNKLENYVNDLVDIDHNISKNRKHCSLLRRLHQDLGVAAKVICMSEKSFSEVMSQMVIEESSREEKEVLEKVAAAKFHTKDIAQEK